ncbi:MAG: HAD family hydrolase [Gemmatimonadota bacterium]|nr:HAD family hydrolase [Gemmatimonadota bacterium]
MTSPLPMGRKAALLDRDGTIIPDRTYTNDPADVSLLPGAAEAIRRLATKGYPSIVITNQSGIARGLVTLSQYRAVRLRLTELLAAEGASLLDTFSCPHHPDFGLPCTCRKPATGMYERAAATHGLDLSRCLFIGDKARDVAPAVAFHGRAALVRSTNTADADVAYAESIAAPAFATLLEAVNDLLDIQQ